MDEDGEVAERYFAFYMHSVRHISSECPAFVGSLAYQEPVGINLFPWNMNRSDTAEAVLYIYPTLPVKRGHLVESDNGIICINSPERTLMSELDLSP